MVAVVELTAIQQQAVVWVIGVCSVRKGGSRRGGEGRGWLPDDGRRRLSLMCPFFVFEDCRSPVVAVQIL